MKKIVIFCVIALGTFNSYALDGFQFVKCFEAATNQTILDYKTVVEKEKIEIKTPGTLGEVVDTKEVPITKGDTTRICDQLSKNSIVEIKKDFIEVYNGHEIPYDSEDIVLATVGDLFSTLRKKVDCYQAYTAKSGLVPTVVNRITEIRNTNLTRDALSKMIGASAEKNLNKSLEELDLKFCKTI